MILRVAGYVDNRSLWFDEAALSVNIMGASWGDLFRPFTDPVQFAPPGFLILQKAAITVLGSGERALRLVPLIAGCAALPLFYGAARTVLRPWAVVIGLGILAVSHPLIYHASEAKPYSLDVALVCGLIWAAGIYDRQGLSLPLAIVWGITGALAAWLSFPATFLLVGMGVVIGIFSIRRKEWKLPSLLIAPWVISIIALYVISIRHVEMDEWLLDYWGHGFVPFSFVSFTLPKWAGFAYLEMIGMAGIILPGVGALACLIGLGSTYGRERKMLLLLLAPLGVAVLAAALRRYPLHERLILFTVPITVLLMAEGVDAVFRRVPKGWGMVLVALLCLPPALRAADHLVFDPHRREEIRDVLEYAAAEARPGDAWYVYHGAEHAFRYYGPRFGISPDRVIHGGGPDLEGLPASGRVWVVFSHLQSRDGMPEEGIMTGILDGIGRRADEAMAPGASVYVYDLTGR